MFVTPTIKSLLLVTFQLQPLSQIISHNHIGSNQKGFEAMKKDS